MTATKCIVIGAITGLALMARVAAQQSESGRLTPELVRAACAPQPTILPAQPGPHVTGVLDTRERRMYAPGDTLVIEGGTSAGLQVGQEFFLRRVPRRFGYHIPQGSAVPLHTVGWIRITETNPRVALAAIVYACDSVLQGDFLQPFQAPVSIASGNAAGVPDYAHLGRVTYGDELRPTAGPAEFILLDRGRDGGLARGDRIAIVRQLPSGPPLRDVGEGVVVLVEASAATVEILQARDAVQTGDLFAVRR
jgi:hypothetical protein